MNSLRVAAVSEAGPESQWYTIGCPKTRFRLEDSAKVFALLDTSVKINMMKKTVMEEASLAIRSGPRLELIFHTSHSRFFLRYSKMLS